MLLLLFRYYCDLFEKVIIRVTEEDVGQHALVNIWRHTIKSQKQHLL